MKLWKLIVVLAAFQPVTVFAKQGSQGFFVSPALFYLQGKEVEKTTNSSSDVESTTTILSASLGYAVGNGLLLGLKYSDGQEDQEFESPGGIGKTEVEVKGIGPAVGYEFGAFKLVATFFVLDDPKRTEKGSGKTIYSEGSGEIYDALYMFDVGSIGIGPQLSMIHMSYKRKEVNGTEDTSFRSRSDTQLLPSVAFWITF